MNRLVSCHFVALALIALFFISCSSEKQQAEPEWVHVDNLKSLDDLPEGTMRADTERCAGRCPCTLIFYLPEGYVFYPPDPDVYGYDGRGYKVWKIYDKLGIERTGKMAECK